MKKISSSFIVLLLCLTCWGQSLERSVISSGGSYLENGGLSLSFTIGEAVITTRTGASFIITEGFQQTDVIAIPTGIEIPEYVNNIIAYPNPTESFLNVDVNTKKPVDLIFELFDQLGRRTRFSRESLKESLSIQHQIDLMGLPAGIYQLLIKTNHGNPVKTFKVIKK